VFLAVLSRRSKTLCAQTDLRAAERDDDESQAKRLDAKAVRVLPPFVVGPCMIPDLPLRALFAAQMQQGFAYRKVRTRTVKVPLT
jgi:hypothetical protein